MIALRRLTLSYLQMSPFKMIVGLSGTVLICYIFQHALQLKTRFSGACLKFDCLRVKHQSLAGENQVTYYPAQVGL